MTPDDIERKASELGLELLAKQFPEDLKTVLENSTALSQRIPKDIHWVEEPAHTFDPTDRRVGRS
ncbi:MAG: hypothetical protein AAF346_08410 [Pseudomonadota bacterium]